jgi:methionyl-tRNA formyltransferase
MADLRIVFMGTPELAVASLQTLTQTPGFAVAAVVTQPDQPKGRGLKVQMSPVKEIARQEKLPVLQPTRAREESFVQELRRLQPDLIVVTAYGQILPGSILEVPRFGCLNVHTSLLPKYRGAAPIQHAILNGDSETGVTIMKMDAGLDTGDILAQEQTPIRANDDSQTLHDRLGHLGARLLAKTIPDFVAGHLHPRPQPIEGVSHAPKIRKQDGQIDWTQPSLSVCNRVRALVPWPVAFTHLNTRPEPLLWKIWQAELNSQTGEPGRVLSADKNGIVVGCGAGSVRILALQREGGRRLTVAEYLAGHPVQPGQVLN